MIKLETLYILAGLMFAAFALFSLQDRSNPRRVVNFLFWGIYAITFMLAPSCRTSSPAALRSHSR
jgi:uncharacterized membrane protein